MLGRRVLRDAMLRIAPQDEAEGQTRSSLHVMPDVLRASTTYFLSVAPKTWMRGPRPRMTWRESWPSRTLMVRSIASAMRLEP
jgi:hypothetical protein